MYISEGATLKYNATVQCDLSAGVLDVYKTLKLDHTVPQC